jgi:uncharacterized protein
MHLVSGTSVAFPLSGLLVGLLIGMTGVGGGSLMTPLLILVFGVGPQTAVGTDLLYVAATKATGAAVHGFGRTVDWRIVGLLSAGSIPATAITLSLLVAYGPAQAFIAGITTAVLGAAMLLAAIFLLFRARLVTIVQTKLPPVGERRSRGMTVALGFALGALVSLTSLGAGALGSTALILLYPNLPVARVVGSDIAHAVPLTLIAGVGHWLFGTVDLPIAGALLIGSIPGIAIGSYLAPRMPERVLRVGLAAILVIVSFRLLLP